MHSVWKSRTLLCNPGLGWEQHSNACSGFLNKNNYVREITMDAVNVSFSELWPQRNRFCILFVSRNLF